MIVTARTRPEALREEGSRVFRDDRRAIFWRGHLYLPGLGAGHESVAEFARRLDSRPLADLAVRRRALFEAVLPGLRAAPARALLAVLRAHARYPLFSLPARLLTTASRLLPTLLVAAFFGPAIAGWFALARRVVATPLQMLATSLGQSYVGWAGGRSPQAVCRMFRKLLLLCLALGALFFLPAAWLAPLLFEILFGAQWGPAGVMVTILAPLYFAGFVFSALRPSWNIIGRLDLDMILAALSLAVMIASFLLARGLALDWEPSLWLFSASLTGVQLFALALLWITVERHARGAGTA